MRTSKFYYSGTIEQVYEITPSLIFLWKLFGSWKLLLADGILSLIYGVFFTAYWLCAKFNVTEVLDFIEVRLGLSESMITSGSFSVLLLIFGVLFLLNSLLIKTKKESNPIEELYGRTLINSEGWFCLILGAMAIIPLWLHWGSPNMVSNLILRLLLGLVGLGFYSRAKIDTAYEEDNGGPSSRVKFKLEVCRYIGIFLMVFVLLSSFWFGFSHSLSEWLNPIMAVLIGFTGIYGIYQSLRLRKSYNQVLSESLGFTDYEIE